MFDSNEDTVSLVSIGDILIPISNRNAPSLTSIRNNMSPLNNIIILFISVPRNTLITVGSDYILSNISNADTESCYV